MRWCKILYGVRSTFGSNLARRDFTVIRLQQEPFLMCANSRCFVAALTLGVAFLLSACSDGPTGLEPGEVVPQGKLLKPVQYRVNSAPLLRVVEREEALEEDERESDFIGRAGGRIELDDAGLTIYFPRGAVPFRTLITVVAPAGNLLGYEFHPHGLVFQKPVFVIQDLEDINIPRKKSLVAAYFEGRLGASVIGAEILSFKKYGDRLVFKIEHFSGYVIATD